MAKCHTGRVTVARNPPAGRLASVTSPPCARRMLRAIGSPSPTPPVSRLRLGSPRWNGSNARSSSCGGMPGPSSSISIVSVPCDVPWAGPSPGRVSRASALPP